MTLGIVNVHEELRIHSAAAFLANLRDSSSESCELEEASPDAISDYVRYCSERMCRLCR